MSVLVRRRSKKAEQENRSNARPKSLYSDPRAIELSQSLSSLHTAFDTSNYEQREGRINGEKGQTTELSDSATPKQERRGSFKSRFLRSKTDSNITFNASSKTDTGQSFKSRFLRKDSRDADSPVEGRRAFRSKYLNKKYNDQLKRIEQYASTKTLDRYESQEESTPSWRAYLDSKAYKSHMRTKPSGEQGDRVVSPKTTKKYDFSTKSYKNTEDADYGIGSPRTRKYLDQDSESSTSYRNFLSSSRNERIDFGGTKSRDTYSGTSSKGSLSGVVSPRFESSRTGGELSYEKTKSSSIYESFGSPLSQISSGWYSKRSGIADLANDFRSPESLHVNQSSGSSPQSQDIGGRISPAGDKSTRRPSTIIRRPRNQFSPRESLKSRDSSSDRSKDVSPGRSSRTSEEKKSERPKSLYLERGEDDSLADKLSSFSPSMSRKTTARPQSMFLRASTPDLSKTEEGEITEETKEKRKKEVEEARRQWRKERSKTTDQEQEKENERSEKSLLLDSDVVLRKPKPSYPIDDGRDSIYGEVKDKSKTTQETSGQGENQTAAINDTEINGDRKLSEIQSPTDEPRVVDITQNGDIPRRRERRERRQNSTDDQTSAIKGETVTEEQHTSNEKTTSEISSYISSRRLNRLKQLAEKTFTSDDQQTEATNFSNGETTSLSVKTSEAPTGESKDDVESKDKDNQENKTMQNSTESKKSRAESEKDITGASESSGDATVASKIRTVTRRKKQDDSSKSRARPSSLYYDDTATIKEESSSSSSRVASVIMRHTDSENDSLTMSSENLRPDIPKIVRRGVSESTDDELFSPVKKRHDSQKKNKSEAKNTQVTANKAKRLQRTRPLSLFFPPEDSTGEGIATRSTVFSTGKWEAPSSTSTVIDHSVTQSQESKEAAEKAKGSTEKEVAQSKKAKETTEKEIVQSKKAKDSTEDESKRSKKVDDDTEVSMRRRGSKDRSSVDKLLDSKYTRERSWKKQELDNDTSSSDTDVPKYVPIRTIDISELLSSSDEDKPLWKSIPDLSSYTSKRPQRKSRFSSRYLTSSDVPKYVPLKTIDISDLLSSSDDEKAKKVEENKIETKDKESKNDDRTLDKWSSRHKVADTSPFSEKIARKSSYKEEKSYTSVIHRNKKQTNIRPKSFHFDALSSTIDDDYKSTDIKTSSVLPKKFNTELDSFRREIDRLLNRADDVKNRSKLLQNKASTITRSYRDLHTKVSDVRGESGDIQNQFEDVEKRLVENDLFGFPNTEEEWHRFFKRGVLIKKAVERIEKQRFQAYEPYYYSDEESDEESVEDLYDLAPGISYVRCRRSFNNSYIGCDISARKISESSDTYESYSPKSRETQSQLQSDKRGVRRRDYLSTDVDDNCNSINLNIMSFAPETVL